MILTFLLEEILVDILKHREVNICSRCSNLVDIKEKLLKILIKMLLQTTKQLNTF